MSLNKLSLTKLKKQCQETLFNSIEKELELNNSQSYIPVFNSSVEIKNNDFSKRLFAFNSKNILLSINPIEEKGDIEKEENNFKISELLQGKINANIINKQIYSQANHYDAYKNYIVTKDIFIKSNPILDVIKYMEGTYKTDIETPSLFSYKTNNKINNINNNAYIEGICCYYLNLLNEKKLTSIFPEFYGTFNGISKNFVHDISEDYEYIKDKDWFIKNNNNLFEIIKHDNLSEFEDLTFENMKKLDYLEEMDKEMDNELENNEVIEIDNLSLEEYDLNMELLHINNDNCIEDNKEEEDNKVEDNIEIDINSCKSYSSDSDLDSNDLSSSLSSLMSDQSCILSEIFSKLKSIPVQVLALELMEDTLSNLIKNDLKKEEWKSILFNICFGLAVAQKHLNFIHNDLHTDNIMYITIKEDYKYFMYQNKYYRVPTFNKEIKIIDFARGILKVGDKKYFSDVFKNDGDAGGQYNYMNEGCCLKKKKKYNFNFDLARLGTTIINYLDDYELGSFVNSWTIGSNGEDFTRMDDDFSVYIDISRYATNCLPKNQINREFFQEFLFNKEDIPENSHVYIY